MSGRTEKRQSPSESAKRSMTFPSVSTTAHSPGPALKLFFGNSRVSQGWRS